MLRDNVLLSPDDEGDLYPFLLNITREWQFFFYASAAGLPEADKCTVTGATLARNSAVAQWNDWMNKQEGHEWFLVHQRYTLEEDTWSKKQGVFLTAGSSLLVVHLCVSVLATVSWHEREGFGPNGQPLALGKEERVDLHCILAPPHDDTLKVLPIPVVPTVKVFNH